MKSRRLPHGLHTMLSEYGRWMGIGEGVAIDYDCYGLPQLSSSPFPNLELQFTEKAMPASLLIFSSHSLSLLHPHRNIIYRYIQNIPPWARHSLNHRQRSIQAMARTTGCSSPCPRCRDGDCVSDDVCRVFWLGDGWMHG